MAARSVKRTLETIWSISVYEGPTPFTMTPIVQSELPVITHTNVSDIQATFVADPFLLKHKNVWHIFMEVMNGNSAMGEIALSSSTDLKTWNFQKVVLKENFHLSYPYVFQWQDDFYMLPETLGASAVRIYKSSNFPFDWKHSADLLSGRYSDPSILRYNQRWWLFVCVANSKQGTLELYYSDHLMGPYVSHPMNPIINGDNAIARPAGRLIRYEESLFRFAQDCQPYYGSAVRAFEITTLSTTDYQEKEIANSPILGATGKNWNSDGMHHIDAHQVDTHRWVAAVDGCVRRFSSSRASSGNNGAARPDPTTEI